MATIVEALDRAARECGIETPDSWITATALEHVELRDDFMLETVYDVLDRVDLPGPIGKTATITGDGSEDYDLPSDFYRMQRDELAVYDVNQDRPCVPVSDDSYWTYIKDIGTGGAIKFYRLRGYPSNWEIDLYTAPDSGSTYKVHYIADVWMANSAGTAGNAFTDPDDVLILPRRVVETGILWRYRQRRGLPFLDKYNEFEALVTRMTNDRRSRRVINMNGADNDVRWQDLVPSFIPSS